MDPSNTLWYVAHTRPRSEKKLAQYCLRNGLEATLPCVTNIRKYQRKTARFENPLFPGYLFLKILPEDRQSVEQSDYCVSLLDVPDQREFVEQLEDILAAVSSESEIRLAPAIDTGTRVKIKVGPLRGVEGVVDRREGSCDVYLQLDFIGQAAVLTVPASDLELI